MNNYFVDTHAHIYDEYYDDIDEVLARAAAKNIKYIINNGCDSKSNKAVLEKLTYQSMWAAFGIHPEAVWKFEEKDFKFIEDNLNHPKVVAIGEIGLDYHYDKSLKEKQIELFARQLELAEKYNLPVIVHSREATQDTIDTLKKYNVKGVIHSFSGSLEVAKIYIKMGFLLGINGVVTFKNSNLKDVLKEIGLENIVLETDSPYLTPHPDRGKKNEPAYVDVIADFICEYHNISKDELSKITNDNIRKMFNKIYLD